MADSAFSPSSALMMSRRCELRLPISVLIWPSSARICGSLPASAALSWVVITCSWLSPPPLSSRDSAPKTSSTVALVVVRGSGMTEPLDRRPCGGMPGGADSPTYCSPSRLACCTWAIALPGRWTLPLMSMVTRAVQLCGGR